MKKERPYWQVALSLLFSLLVTAAVIFIGIRAIVYFMPFVLGWIISSIAAPLVNWLEKRFNIVKKLGSAMVVVFVIGAIVLGLYFAVSRLVVELVEVAKNIPELYEQFETGLRQIGDTLSGLFSRLPEGLVNGWNTLAKNLDQYAGDIVSKISEPTLVVAGNFAKGLPSFLVSFLAMILSSYFFTVEREELIQWAKKTAPEALSTRMTLVMDNLRYAVGGYFKAQFKIMGVVFLILLAGFAFLRVNYFALVAFLIAFLDFLPFFGTGTAIFPWAAYKFLTGDFRMAILLLVIYAATQILRQVLQPKLVADSMGLHPLLTLFFLYIGYRMGSVLGMILAVPVGMVLLNMYRAGAFDYIIDDVKILVDGILGLRKEKD